MVGVQKRKIRWTISLFLVILYFSGLPAQAKYGGGTGEPNEPYQIATAEDLFLLGDSPEDYDKHFILTADIDLDPNLPDGKVFDKAVIAPDMNDANWEFDGTSFTGVFDGNGHKISHLTIQGVGYLGLFGQLASGAVVKELGSVDVNITGSGDYVGGLVGANGARRHIGSGSVTSCYTTGTVSGRDCVGGLVGTNWGYVSGSCSAGMVYGGDSVGGLVGGNGGGVVQSYSRSAVIGISSVGGLVGKLGLYVMLGSAGSVDECYSTGAVTGTGEGVGGLVGEYTSSVRWANNLAASFWDRETSGLAASAGGTGKTTAEMQDPNTFMAVGWDFVGQPDGPHDIWARPEGGGYPILWWQQSPLPELPRFSGGSGEPNDPYTISTSDELNSIGHNPRLMKSHFRLIADLDLNDLRFYPIGDYNHPYGGVFDGCTHTISHLNLIITGGDSLGLFGQLAYASKVRDLGVVDVNIAGRNGVGAVVGCSEGDVTDCYGSGAVNGNCAVGGLVGSNLGNVTLCYSTGAVSGNSGVGGLVGSNLGNVTLCYSTGAVSGNSDVGGLVGSNLGNVTLCYSTGAVSGGMDVGGLVGSNLGNVTLCYSTGAVSGNSDVGGLVGVNYYGGTVTQCYSSGSVSGNDYVGGMVGSGSPSWVTHSIWDTKTSGLSGSAGGVGLTTEEMMDPYILGLNGFANDPNWILDAGRDYPRLAWEGTSGDIIPESYIDWLEGNGTAENPYRIDTADQLIFLGKASILWNRHFVLGANINLDPSLPGRSIFGQAVIPVFTGVFAGRGHVISNLMIVGESYLGMFGQLRSGAEVKNLGVVDVFVTGKGSYVGGLVGQNDGTVTQCYSTGTVRGNSRVGGLVGSNCQWGGEGGTVTDCYSSGAVSGTGENVGGLVGYNYLGTVADCYSSGAVSGNSDVGGLVGINLYGSVTQCYSSGSVNGNSYCVGGLVGRNEGTMTYCYSTGTVSGEGDVGGLVGLNRGTVLMSYSTGAATGNTSFGGNVGGLVGANDGTVSNSYSTGAVSGNRYIGGLVGFGSSNYVTACFWDIETSGQTMSAGGTGKTTAKMQTAKTFLDAGWDFVDETANGTEDIWWILEGQDYPHLWWELVEE